jgi:hypothetical protein
LLQQQLAALQQQMARLEKQLDTKPVVPPEPTDENPADQSRSEDDSPF